MEILSVTLINFKAHSDRVFEFQPGTNAICGENGAGKTSILEAIAWALFDYKGDYKVEDLIRNGTASAQVCVSMISSRDQRTYQVNRCTRSGYNIYDPQLGQKLGHTRIKDEVLPWLRQHMGVSPGTDLADLFGSTIGVPQGMFAADFLLEASKRKPIFDKVLKVEEYQKTWKELASLEKYSKTESERVDREISQCQDALQDWDGLSAKRNELTQEITTLTEQLTQCRLALFTLEATQQKVGVQIQAANAMTQKIDRATIQIQSQQKRLVELNQDVESAQRSVEICTSRREAFGRFQLAETALKELEQFRSQQQSLFQQKQTLIQNTSDQQVRLAAITTQIDRLNQSEQELQPLRDRTVQQEIIETKERNLREQLQTCNTWRQAITRDERRLQQLKIRDSQLQQELDRLATLGKAVQQLPELEDQQQRIQQQLSRIAAASQFELDLKRIMALAIDRGTQHSHDVSVIAATLKQLENVPNIGPDSVAKIRSALLGGTQIQAELMQDLQLILTDLSKQTDSDRQQRQLLQIQAQIKTLRLQQQQFLTRESKHQEAVILRGEIIEVRNHLTDIQKHLASEPQLKQQLSEVTIDLTDLGDPRARSRILTQELQGRSRLLQQQSAIASGLTTTTATLAQIDRDLQTFETLPQQIREQQQHREASRGDYELYLKNREIANRYRPLFQQHEDLANQTETLETQLVQLRSQQTELSQGLDPAFIHQLTQDLTTSRNQQATLTAQIPMNQKLLAEYTTQITKLQSVQNQLKDAQEDLKHRQKTDRFIKFSRKAFKEAGPRITERYVQNIAYEADKLFRELLNRPNVALDWTRDYEIIVREGANDRRFVTLSGGEQMCAALAVRLALLKVLADINIAFFDEPTTNMDRPRRVKLAEAIANIKTFRQLFVISHDDTFEQVTEHVIVVQRES